LLRNVGSNWVLTLVTIGATYVLTPFVIHVLGPEGYWPWEFRWRPFGTSRSTWLKAIDGR